MTKEALMKRLVRRTQTERGAVVTGESECVILTEGPVATAPGPVLSSSS